jgi:peptide/nickel transport system permease protein
MELFFTIIKRIIGIVVVVSIATFCLSLLMWLLPGDPAVLASGASTPEGIEQARASIGLDRGVFGYFFYWYTNMLQGDFGNYYSNGATYPVMDAVKRTLPVTLQLVFYSQVVALVFSIPLGLLAAYKENSKFDKVLTNVLFTAVSFPNFALALILILIFSLKLGWVDPVGYMAPSEDLVQHFKLMILPVAAISIGLTSSYTRLLRTDVIATLKEDYVTMPHLKASRTPEFCGVMFSDRHPLPCLPLLRSIWEHLLGVPLSWRRSLLFLVLATKSLHLSAPAKWSPCRA